MTADTCPTCAKEQGSTSYRTGRLCLKHSPPLVRAMAKIRDVTTDLDWAGHHCHLCDRWVATQQNERHAHSCPSEVVRRHLEEIGQ